MTIISRHGLRISAIVAVAMGAYLQIGCTYESSPPPQAVSDQPPEQYEPPPAPVVTEYQQDLDSYGSWVTVADYGQCWSPGNRPDGWQPYTVGHWEYCDAGW